MSNDCGNESDVVDKKTEKWKSDGARENENSRENVNKCNAIELDEYDGNFAPANGAKIQWHKWCSSLFRRKAVLTWRLFNELAKIRMCKYANAIFACLTKLSIWYQQQ